MVFFCFDAARFLHASWNTDACQAFISRKVRTYLGIINEHKQNAKPEDLLTICHTLSNIIIKPIEAFLRNYQHIIFVPSGDIAQFPLSSLFLDEECMRFVKDISQVPSMEFYLHHSQSHDARKLKRFTATARPGTTEEEVLPNGEVRLPMGGVEALIASEIFDQPPMNAANMTRQDFRDEFQQSTFVHICTHGYFEQERLLTSYLSFRQHLRVLD